MHPAVAEGIRLFNSRKFFEAHEALEAVWLTASGEERIFLHGLIQVAAAFHHFQRNNERGFCSLLKKGSGKLQRHSRANCGIDAEDLLRQLQPWLDGARANRADSLPWPAVRAL